MNYMGGLELQRAYYFLFFSERAARAGGGGRGAAKLFLFSFVLVREKLRLQVYEVNV